MEMLDDYHMVRNLPQMVLSQLLRFRRGNQTLFDSKRQNPTWRTLKCHVKAIYDDERNALT
jgi:hypothetical protein